MVRYIHLFSPRKLAQTDWVDPNGMHPLTMLCLDLSEIITIKQRFAYHSSESKHVKFNLVDYSPENPGQFNSTRYANAINLRNGASSNQHFLHYPFLQ